MFFGVLCMTRLIFERMIKLMTRIIFVIFISSSVIMACHPANKLAKTTGDITKRDSILGELLKKYPAYFDSILTKQETYGVQIIYTQIDRDKNNNPELTDHYYNVNPKKYFYPASTVKLPVALLSLQKLNELNIQGLDKYSTMITNAEYGGQTEVFNDPTTPDGRPNIAHYIKKIFLVSDNDAFNRLYEFLGQEYINHSLSRKGYDDAQIIHRLNISLPEDQNRHTNPVKFYDSAAHLVYEKPLQKSNLRYIPRDQKRGNGYYSGDKFIDEPFDFSKKNQLSLPDLHRILRSVIFPSSVRKSQRFNLAQSDYRFLYKYMSIHPRESLYPSYDTSEYGDAYVKFILYGSGKATMDDEIRIFNKVGDAYGFLTDVAYVVDFKNNIEFMLSATIYCNSDDIYNDDKYDYDSIGFPFMKNLGKIIYDYELTRTRKNPPDLSAFKMEYKE